MKKCSNCKGMNPDDFVFCRHCGEDLVVFTPKEELEVKKFIEESKMANPYSLGIWGPRASGKTTYIIMTYGACVKGQGNWRTVADDLKTHQFISSHLTKLFKTGEFPPATDPTKKPEIYSFAFRPVERKKPEQKTQSAEADGGPRGLFRQLFDFPDEPIDDGSGHNTDFQIRVSFSDVSGEQYFKAEYEDPVWELLASSKGLICLLDPGLPEEHFEMTNNMLNILRLKGNHTALPHRIAFCFSKIDQPEFFKYHTKPDELIEELANNSGINLRELVQTFTHSSRVRFFTLSSVGVNQNGESLCDGAKVNEPKKIKPLNIIEPLEWFFKEAKKEQAAQPSKKK